MADTNIKLDPKDVADFSKQLGNFAAQMSSFVNKINGLTDVNKSFRKELSLSVDTLKKMEDIAKHYKIHISDIHDNLRDSEVFLKEMKSLEEDMFDKLKDKVELEKESFDIQNKITELKKKPKKPLSEESLDTISTYNSLLMESERRLSELQKRRISEAKSKHKVSDIDKDIKAELAKIKDFKKFIRDIESSDTNSAKISAAEKKLEIIKKKSDDIETVLSRNASKLKGFKTNVRMVFAEVENSIMENVSRITKIPERHLTKILHFLSGGKGFSGPMLHAILFLAKLSSYAIKTVLKMDEEFFKMRKHFGLMRGEDEALERIGRNVARQYVAMGVTIESAIQSINELGSTFGRASVDSEEIVKNVSLFTSQLGIAEKTSVSFLKTLSTISGKTVQEASVGMLGLTRSMSVAAGVPLPDVMNDVAQASESVRNTFRGNTLELIKATVEARRYGLSLESSARTAESMLDFNQSVNAEMEASILFGRNINLMNARRLAWAGDYIGLNKEILNILKEVGDFDKMNIYHKKALAAATGKSLDELQTMSQREKQIAWVRANGSDAAKKSLETYEKLSQLKEEDAKNEGLSAEKVVQKIANQERMTILQNQFNQLMMDLSEPLMDLTGTLLDIATVILPPILKGLSYGASLFVPVVSMSSRIAAYLIEWSASLTKTAAKFSFVMSIAKVFMGILKVFTKLTPIGWIITIIDVFKNLEKMYNRINDIFGYLGLNSDSDTIGFKLLKGIVAITGSLLQAIIQPFWDAGKWILEKSGLIGHSPSELGLSIVEGIKSIGDMLFNVLTKPFETAWNFIGNIFNIQNLGTQIVSKFKLIGTMIVSSLTSIFKTPSF